MNKIKIRASKRLNSLAPYLFVEIDKEKRKAKAAGRDIIDLGIGDPDQPTPEFIIEAFNKAAQDGSNHHYSLDAGLPQLREHIAQWYLEKFNVKLDPVTQILPLIGSKEGLAHLPLGLVNPGDKVLIPDPAYPVYRSASIFAAGTPAIMPLLERNGFLPDLGKLPKAKLAFINYPNNPTGAVADIDFYERMIAIARKNNTVLASDFAYSELFYDNVRPLSLLQVKGGLDVGVEFHSLSKTYNMTGWRIGWICGNSQVITLLGKVKSNIDSGIFPAIQIAAITALKDRSDFCANMRKLYQERRDAFVEGLLDIGWKVKKPAATFYIWAANPTKESSLEFSRRLLKEADIVATPGVGFGKFGEGYVRFALTVSKERLVGAVERIKKII